MIEPPTLALASDSAAFSGRRGSLRSEASAAAVETSLAGGASVAVVVGRTSETVAEEVFSATVEGGTTVGTSVVGSVLGPCVTSSGVAKTYYSNHNKYAAAS